MFGVVLKIKIGKDRREMQGKIEKGIAGFYYVHVPKKGIYECKAKGVFRNRKVKPLVGDDVEIAVLDQENRIGNIMELYPRKNTLIRPAVANIDQALVIFAVTDPLPNLNLLDRFLIMMEQQKVDTIICFNKQDLAEQEQLEKLKDCYAACGYPVLFSSNSTLDGMDQIKEVLVGKTTVLAGPSGVGKSSLLNWLNPKANMEVGGISEKIRRGKHTTRHSELFYIEELGKNTYVFDTPGFTSLYLMDLEAEQLKDYFVEFRQYEENCRFKGCVHVREPDCRVKQALEEGKISSSRYKNYMELYQELYEKKKY